MPQNSHLTIKNYFTSSDSQFLTKVHRKVEASEKDRFRTSQLVKINPLETDIYVNLTKARYFLICRSCLWCASCIKNQTTFTKCPLCYNGEIDCMPIGEDNDCVFDYSHSRHFELKFANNIRC